MSWGDAAAGAGAGLSVLSTAVGIAGSQAAGAAKARAANYRAAVARNNALILRQQGEYAVEAGQRKAELESLRGADLQGKIKANQGASGVDVNTGSNVNVRAGARMASKLNTDTVLTNAQLLNYGYLAKAQEAEAGAGLAGMEAGSAQEAADWQSAATLLSGASQFPLKWGSGGGGGGGTPPDTGISSAAP